MPMTAKMKIMMKRTKERLASAPKVLDRMVKMSLSAFHDLASLNTRSNLAFITLGYGYYYGNFPMSTVRSIVNYAWSLPYLNDLSMESPSTFSNRSSTSDSATMTKSKMFHPSYNERMNA